jgi:succinyl-diaminopimelate desuccinylase
MSLPVDPAENLAALIRCPSVTPSEGGALRVLAGMLRPLGFRVERPVFSSPGMPDVENLYARLGDGGRNLMFAGHTDVVPPGEEEAWSYPPFSAMVADGAMYGRGAVDMKGGIACFVAAVARLVGKRGSLPGSLSLVITGDEEGAAVNGTVRLLEWAAARGERWDAAIVGEPTNPEAIGDMIKIGRRGSLSGEVRVRGRQGHAAYPDLADNAVRGLLMLADALLSPPLDSGTENFQPSNLEITALSADGGAVNVVPGRASLSFNVRFCDRWSEETLKAELESRLARAARRRRLRPGRRPPVTYEVVWKPGASPVFLTRDEKLIGTLSEAVARVTGRRPALSTSGGTSDARFIKDYCPVVEFGLVGKTMHMIDEHVVLSDLETLTGIYEDFIANWFS